MTEKIESELSAIASSDLQKEIEKELNDKDPDEEQAVANLKRILEKKSNESA